MALIDRVPHRIGDMRVLALMKAFLNASLLSEDGGDTTIGTPQEASLSPLLVNVALAILDDHLAEAWTLMG